MTRFLYLSRKAMHRIDPRMIELDNRLRDCRKNHKRGAAAIIRAKREIVHADLAAKLFPDEKQRRRVEESW